jgi:hypothetical protein
MIGNRFYDLPNELKTLIWEYDNTYKNKYNSCIKEIKCAKDLHKIYKKRNYGLKRKSEYYSFSQYCIKWYNNKKYSKLLFKYYYGNIFGNIR